MKRSALTCIGGPLPTSRRRVFVTKFVAPSGHSDKVTRREPDAGTPSSREKVVSRGEGISEMPCAISSGAENPIAKFPGEPQPGDTVKDSMHAEVEAMFGEIYRSFEKENNKREHEAAEADPKAHKLSRVMLGKGGLNYHYWPAGVNGRRQKVRFCWSTHRNCAGYFLGWREVVSKNQTKRDRWVARKSRIAVKKIAQRRAGKTNPAVTLT